MPELDVHADFIVPAPNVPVTPPAVDPPTPPADPGKPDPATPPAATPAPPIEFTTEIAAAPTPPLADTVVVYNPTGEAGLDVALQYVGARGFGPDHPAIVAATKGDFAVLEAELAKLGDKAQGFKAYVDLAKDSYGRRQSAVKAASEKTTEAVYKAVGGADKWAAIKAWAQEAADPAEKEQLNAAFKAGGLLATAVAEKLAAQYQRAGGKPKSVVKSDAASSAPSGTDAIDGKQFGQLSAELFAKLGNRMQESREYQDLVARRRAFRG